MQILERFTGANPVLMDYCRETSLYFAADGTFTRDTLKRRGKPGLSVSLHSWPTGIVGMRHLRLVVSSRLRGGEVFSIAFEYQWVSYNGKMGDKAIYVSVQSCEGVEDGQALLLLFQRVWQADRLSFYALFKSLCQCAAIILASRSIHLWRVDQRESQYPDHWETGQQGPRLRLLQRPRVSGWGWLAWAGAKPPSWLAFGVESVDYWRDAPPALLRGGDERLLTPITTLYLMLYF
jgi:hypothetical protein